MALIDVFKHTLPMKLKDGKRHIFPTVASLVYRKNDQPLEDENGVLTADDSSKLGGIPAEEYALKENAISAQVSYNLLDNSNFEIAQLGYNQLHVDEKYAADRWASTTDGTLTVTGEIKTYTSSSGYNYTVQRLWKDGRDVGKSYTLAIELDDGTTKFCSGTVPASISSNTTIAEVSCGNNCSVMIYKHTSGLFMVRINAKSDNASVSFKHLRMFEGIYTAENLPPYISKGYAVEMLECQRYFYALDVGYLCFGSVNQSSSMFYGTIETSTEMIGTPSIYTTSNKFSLCNNEAQVNMEGSLTVQRKTGRVIQIMLPVQGKGMKGAIVSKLWFTDGTARGYLTSDLK